MFLDRCSRTILVLSASIFLGACTPVNPLTVTSKTTTGGSSGCSSSNGPILDADIFRLTNMTGGVPSSSSIQCMVSAATAGGTPLAIGSASMNPPGGGTIIMTEYASNPACFADSGTGWTYQPGQSYTFHITAGGATYSATVTAPGGSATIPSFGSGGGPITWSNPGNSDSLTIGEGFSPYTNTTLQPIASGGIGTSAATYFPSAGTYYMHLSILKLSPACAFASGANAASEAYGEDAYDDDDTK
jgi:hypothetical protein